MIIARFAVVVEQNQRRACPVDDVAPGVVHPSIRDRFCTVGRFPRGADCVEVQIARHAGAALGDEVAELARFVSVECPSGKRA